MNRDTRGRFVGRPKARSGRGWLLTLVISAPVLIFLGYALSNLQYNSYKVNYCWKMITGVDH